MRIYVVIFPESDEGCATFSTIEAAAECIRKELEEAIDDTMTREEYNDYVKEHPIKSEYVEAFELITQINNYLANRFQIKRRHPL